MLNKLKNVNLKISGKEWVLSTNKLAIKIDQVVDFSFPQKKCKLTCSRYI